jgi:hypothetical protein
MPLRIKRDVLRQSNRAGNQFLASARGAGDQRRTEDGPKRIPSFRSSSVHNSFAVSHRGLHRIAASPPILVSRYLTRDVQTSPNRRHSRET